MPETPKPFVSVIVPVYNAEDMIGECIEALLAQDYPKDRYEIIIVDNDSTDGTAELIKRYPVKYLLEDEIHTSYAARNTGARHARGEALAFCDADQIATESWLPNLLSHWHERDKYAGFCGPYPLRPFQGSLAERYHCQESGQDAYLGEQNQEVEWWGGGNLCVDAEDFRQIGGFPSAVASGGDHQFTLAMSHEKGRRWLYVGGARQHHRPRSSLDALLRQVFRLGYGYEQRDAEFRTRTISSCGFHLARSFVLMPLRVLNAMATPPGQDGAVRVYAAFADPLLALADSFGRLLGYLGLPSELASGM